MLRFITCLLTSLLLIFSPADIAGGRGISASASASAQSNGPGKKKVASSKKGKSKQGSKKGSGKSAKGSGKTAGKSAKGSNRSAKDVRREKKQTEAEIRETRKKMQLNAEETSRKLSQLNQVEGEIDQCNARISQISGRLDTLNASMKVMQDSVDALNAHLQKITESYIKAIKRSQARRQQMSALAFIFSSDSFAQAWRRTRYLKQFARWRERKSREILAARDLLEQKKKRLAVLAGQANNARTELAAQRSGLVRKQDETEALVKELRGESAALKQVMRDQSQRAAALDKELDDIIAREIARQEAARREAERREAARKAAAEKAAAEKAAAEKAAAEKAAAEKAEADRRAAAAKAEADRKAAEEAARKAAEEEAEAQRKAAAAKAEADKKAAAAQKEKTEQARKAAEAAKKAEQEAAAAAKKAAKKAEQERKRKAQAVKHKRKADEDAAKAAAAKAKADAEAKAKADAAKAKADADAAKSDAATLHTPDAAADRGSASKEVIPGADFESLRGKLPYPITGNYTIVKRFGRQKHPSLPHVETNNAGIDIQTSKGAAVRAVCDGVVSAVFRPDGYNTVVVIRHGQYMTVYANLGSTSVSTGQKVKAGQNIGNVFADPKDNGRSVLHFEIRNGRAKENPQSWLR